MIHKFNSSVYQNWLPQKEERASHRKSTLLSKTPVLGVEVIRSNLSRRFWDTKNYFKQEEILIEYDHDK